MTAAARGLLAIAFSVAAGGTAAADPPTCKGAPKEPVSWAKDIHPKLAELYLPGAMMKEIDGRAVPHACFSCHGWDRRINDLDLWQNSNAAAARTMLLATDARSEKFARRHGKKLRYVVPFDLEGSALFEEALESAFVGESKQPFAAQIIELLRRWICTGAAP